MDSQESLNHHHHQNQELQANFMNPNSIMQYNLINTNTNAAVSSHKNVNYINPNAIQEHLAFSCNDQFGGDGSIGNGNGNGNGLSNSGGFRGGGYSNEMPKKKRGRPRKYSASGDGNVGLGLCPAPVNAVAPNGDGGGGNLEFSNDGSGGNVNVDSLGKKHRGRPPGSGKKQLNALGSAGVGFTPHVIIVNAGEDIATTMVSFSQQGPRTVCILSANGAISNVTLRQPATSGGTVTYEGRFEIISLSGSFVHSEGDGNNSKPSGLSVSLAGSDGRVLGGGVAGMLVAASPVQVIVGSFIADTKKPKSTSRPSPVAPPNMLNFGGGGGAVPGASPPSEGPSSDSSDESGSSPLHMIPGSYNNITHHQQAQHQQQQAQYQNSQAQHQQAQHQQPQHQQPQHQHPQAQHQQAQHHQHHQEVQNQNQQQPQRPMQNLPMYSNMGWSGSTMNMLPD